MQVESNGRFKQNYRRDQRRWNPRNRNAQHFSEQTFCDENSDVVETNDEEQIPFIEEFGFDISLKPGKNETIVRPISSRRSQRETCENDVPESHPIYEIRNISLGEITDENSDVVETNDEEQIPFIEEFGFDISLKPGKNETIVRPISSRRSQRETCENDVPESHPIYEIRNISLGEDNELWNLTTPVEDEGKSPNSPVIPDDVVTLGHQIEKMKVSDVFRKGSKAKVMVLGIYDISKFWISVDFPTLEDFARDIDNFYEYSAWNYIIPVDLIKKKLYCVASLHGVFSRAVIINEKYDVGAVKLFFIDYGIVATEDVEKLYFLVQEFSYLPAQAVRARLAGVRPLHKNMTWPIAAVKNFRDMASFQQFKADIVEIDKSSNFMWVRLDDTDDVSVSSVLATNGHVIFEREHQKTLTVDENCRAKVEFIQHFPIFEDLENGVVPWSSELTQFWNTTVTMDFLIPQYFQRCTDRDLMDKIEKKMEAEVKKERKMRKCFRSGDVEKRHGIEEMNKIAYGPLYDILKGEPEDRMKSNSKESHHIYEKSQGAHKPADPEVAGRQKFDESALRDMRMIRLESCFNRR